MAKETMIEDKSEIREFVKDTESCVIQFVADRENTLLIEERKITGTL
jgi:hypothetical protein